MTRNEQSMNSSFQCDYIEDTSIYYSCAAVVGCMMCQDCNPTCSAGVQTDTRTKETSGKSTAAESTSASNKRRRIISMDRMETDL
jgi:hypothetical protein